MIGGDVKNHGTLSMQFGERNDFHNCRIDEFLHLHCQWGQQTLQKWWDKSQVHWFQHHESSTWSSTNAFQGGCLWSRDGNSPKWGHLRCPGSQWQEDGSFYGVHKRHIEANCISQQIKCNGNSTSNNTNSMRSQCWWGHCKHVHPKIPDDKCWNLEINATSHLVGYVVHKKKEWRCAKQEETEHWQPGMVKMSKLSRSFLYVVHTGPIAPTTQIPEPLLLPQNTT